MLRSRICFFTGENGSGKSTLLEAMAIHYGFGREGGTRSFSVDTTESNHSVDALVRALRLSFNLRTGRGFFLRAESFFNTASYPDAIDGGSGDVLRYYGGRSLHDHSHGETFFKLLELKFQRNGLFLLDEPEAALSPQRQLAFLVLLHDVLKKYRTLNSSFRLIRPYCLVIRILKLSPSTKDRFMRLSTRMQIVRHFVNQRESFLPSLFKDES